MAPERDRAPGGPSPPRPEWPAFHRVRLRNPSALLRDRGGARHADNTAVAGDQKYVDACRIAGDRVVAGSDEAPRQSHRRKRCLTVDSGTRNAPLTRPAHDIGDGE